MTKRGKLILIGVILLMTGVVGAMVGYFATTRIIDADKGFQMMIRGYICGMLFFILSLVVFLKANEYCENCGNDKKIAIEREYTGKKRPKASGRFLDRLIRYEVKITYKCPHCGQMSWQNKYHKKTPE